MLSFCEIVGIILLISVFIIIITKTIKTIIDFLKRDDGKTVAGT